MGERGWGRIVNITSSSVKAPIASLPLSSGARVGLTGVVAGVAREVARRGVTINNLLPGAFATDRLLHSFAPRAAQAGVSRRAGDAAAPGGDSRPGASASRPSSAPPARSCAACTPPTSRARTC